MVANLTDARLEQERTYYLPSTGSGLESSWESRSASQERYIDLCQRGHTLIANQITEGMKAGRLPTVQDLYRTAAKVRRAIAELNQAHSENFLLYGQPHASSFDQGLRDPLQMVKSSRYYDIFEESRELFYTLAQRMRTENHQDLFGESYTAKYVATSREREREISVFHSDFDQRIAEIKLVRSDGPALILNHAVIRDHPRLFSLADAHWQALGKQEVPDAEAFFKELAEISLHLYHAAPLRLGSQTATLLVLAGITKAMGYEVVPRRLDTDHFIEAELIPYREYTETYGNKFERPPVYIGKPGIVSVDESFIAEAEQKTRERHAIEADPCKRLAHYMNVCWDKPEGLCVTVTSLEIDGEDMQIRVHPLSEQKIIDYACDFVGRTNIINALGLPQGKYMNNPPVRVSARDISRTQSFP